MTVPAIFIPLALVDFNPTVAANLLSATAARVTRGLAHFNSLAESSTDCFASVLGVI